MKKLFFTFFCSIIAVSVIGAEINDRLALLLPLDIAKALSEQGYVKKSAYRQPNTKIGLTPAIDIAMEAVSFWSGEAAPFYSESLYLYKKIPARQGNQGIDTGKVSIILRSLSHLQGLEYYSSSRKKMRTLYEKSYVVDSAKGRTRIPDPIQGSADGMSLNAVQKDLTFGEYLYNYSYRQNGDTVAFFSRNIDAMNYSILKVVEPDKLHVSLVVHDMGDSLLVYSLTRADFMAIPGIEGKLNLSFSTRAEAMYNWFIKEYERQ
jgi:hypothetical protein